MIKNNDLNAAVKYKYLNCVAEAAESIPTEEPVPWKRLPVAINNFLKYHFRTRSHLDWIYAFRLGFDSHDPNRSGAG
jgi:hypothetical protein